MSQILRIFRFPPFAAQKKVQGSPVDSTKFRERDPGGRGSGIEFARGDDDGPTSGGELTWHKSIGGGRGLHAMIYREDGE